VNPSTAVAALLTACNIGGKTVANETANALPAL